VTIAVLFDNMRGSGRDVAVTLGTAGLEIATAEGNAIGVWPYGAIKRARVASQAWIDLQLANDETRTLQIYDRKTTDAILALTPGARRRGLFERLGVNETYFRFEIALGLMILVVAIVQAWRWLTTP
jgi:hypothetical protein